MLFLPMVFFINGLAIFLMSCPYQAAFILPSNLTMGPILCQEKQPQIMTELLLICTVGPVHLMECVCFTKRCTQTLPLLWTLTNSLLLEITQFSNPQPKNVHVVWPCVWSGTLSGHFSFFFRKSIFQQDNAPIHTAKSISKIFKNLKMKVLDWPAQSPDLNPIENIWRRIKFGLSSKNSKNKNDLKKI